MALEINSEKLIESFDKLTGSLEKLEKQIQDTGKDVSAFDKLFGSTKNFDDFVTSIKRIGNVSTDSFKVIADGISSIAKSISLLKGTESSTSFAVFSTLPDAFRNIQFLAKDTTTITAINAISSVIRAVVKLSQSADIQAAMTNVETVGKVVSRLAYHFESLDALKGLNASGAASSVNSISALINSIARLSDVDLTGVKIPPGFSETLRELLNVINGLPTSAEQKNVNAFQKIVGSIAQVITGPLASVGSQNAQDIAGTLSSLARAMQTLSKVNLDSAKIGQIAKSFAKLGLAFQAIGFVLKFIPGGKELGEFSKTIQRLGIGLASLSRASGALDTNAIKKLVISITAIAGITKVLSKLLNFGNDKNAENFAKVIGSVATAINAIASLNKISVDQSKDLTTLIEPIVKIISSFKKLKDVKIVGLGDVVKGIADIIKAVSLPGDIQGNLEKTPVVVDKIVSSLTRLGGIRFGGAGGLQGNIFGDVRNALLQVEIIKKLVPLFTQLVGGVLNFQKNALETFRTVGREAEQFGQNLINVAKRINDSFSLNALQSSGEFNIAQEFERTSSLLEAAGLNDEQLQLAQDFADTIGIQYPLSANQALDAILDLTRAGRDLSEIQFILPNASDLAALAEGDLEGVTRTLIGVAGAFQQFTSDVEGGFSTIETATNLISAAADVGTSTVASLSQALANVGPSANAAGLTLEETLAILTQFEDANIRGAEAGTQLRSVLNSLASPRARDELRRLGVETVNADGTLRDLNDIIVDINDAYQTLGLTEAERQLSINQLADSYARQGLNVLLLRDGFQATVDAMGESATAADKAQQSMDNLAGDTEQLRGSLETLYKDILYPLINRAFRPLTQITLQFVNALLQVPDPIKDIVSVMVQLVATFGTIAAISLTVIGAFSILGGGVLTLVSNIGLLILNLPAVVGGVAAIVASLSVALPVILAFGAAFVGVSAYVSQFYRSVEENVGGAGDAFERFKTTVSNVFSEVRRIFDAGVRVFDNLFGSVFGKGTIRTGERVAGVFNRLNEFFQNLLTTLSQIQDSDIVAFFERLSPFIRGFLNSFERIGSGIFSLITGNFEDAAQQIRRGAADILSLITDIIQRITGLNLGDVVRSFNAGDIRAGATELIQSVIRIVQNLIRQNVPVLRQAFEGILNIINPINGVEFILRILGLENFANVIDSVSNTIISGLGSVFSVVIRLFSGESFRDVLGNDIGGALTTLFEAVTRFARPIVDFFTTLFSILGTDASNAAESFSERFIDVGATLRSVALFINRAADSIINFLSPITRNLPQIIRIIEDFVGNIISDFGPIVPFLEGVFSDIGRLISRVGDFIFGRINFATLARETIQSLINVLKDIPGILGQILSNLGETLQSEMLSNIGAAFQRGDIVGGILGFIVDLGRELYRRAAELFVTLGERLGITFLTAIGQQLQAGEVLRAIIAGVEGIRITLQNILSGLAEAIRAGTDQIAQNIGPIGGFFVRVLGEALILFVNIANAARFQIIGLIESVLRLVDAILHIPGSLIVALIATITGVFAAFPGVILGALSSVAAALTSFGAFITGALSALATGFITFIALAVHFVTNLPSIIGTAFITLRNTIAAAIDGQGGIINILRRAGAAMAQFAAMVVIINALSAAADNLGKVISGEQNVLEGFLNFFVDLVDKLLALVGLDDEFEPLLAGVRVTISQLGTIFDIFIQNLVRDFRHGVDLITVGIQDAFHRIELALGTGNAATTQFFAVGDALANQAQLSAQEFFSTLGAALEHPEDIGTLSAQLRASAGAIVSEFSEFLSDGGTVAQLAAQGLLDDLADTLATSGTLGDAFALLGDDIEGALALFGELSAEDQAESFDVFFNSVLSGLQSNAPALESTLELLDQLVQSGAITAEQAAQYTSRIVPTTAEAQRVLDDYNASLLQQVQDTESARQAALDYAYSLNGLQEAFDSTLLSAEEMGDQFRDIISGLTAEEIELDQLFDLFSQLSPEEAAASFGIFFEAAIRGGVAEAGNEEYFEMLQTQIDDLRNSSLITGEQRRTFLDRLAIEAQTASTALDETTSKLTNLQRLVQNSQARLDALRAAGKGNLPEISPVPPFDPNASGVDDYITKQEEEIAERISEFAEEEAKRLKDDVEEEKKAAKELEKLKNGVDQDELDRISDFNRETEQREQDHQIALQKIRDNAAAALESAVADRDSAAAQAALKARNKELKEEEDKFRLDEQRRLEEEDIRRQRYERERQEKILQAEQDLADLIAKNFAEREERKREFQDELNDLKAKNAEVNAQNQAAYQQVATTNAQTVANTVAAANSIRSALTNALNAVLSGTNGGSGKGGKGGKGGFENKAGWSFDGLEELVIWDDPSKKKSGSGNIPSPFNSGFRLPPPPSGFKQGSMGVRSFETGGRLPYTGYFFGHEDEQILNRQQAHDYRAGNTNTNNVQVSPQITVNAAPGMDTNALAQQIEQRVVQETIRAIEQLPGGKV